jgi:AraC-like DNA-binding protein
MLLVRHPCVTDTTRESGAEVTTTLPELTTVVPENSIRFHGHDTHAHPVPHLVHVVTGAAEVVADGQTFRLAAKESLWLAPDVPHSARYTPGSVVLGPFLSPSTLPSGRVQRLGVVPRLTQLMATVLGAAPTTAEQVQPFRSALDALLLSLRGEFFALHVPGHPVARAVARAASSGRTLDELATAHRSSVRQVQRNFRAETGMPFSTWRARARLNVAIGRLRAGDSLTVAAHAAGYSTRSGLLKALSRETGLPEQALARDPVAALGERRSAAR